MNLNQHVFSSFNEDEEDDKKEKKEGQAGMMMFAKKFLEQRKIFLWGQVDDDSAKDVITKLLYLEAEKPGKPITFYINSPGGVVTAGMAIHDTMKLISSPVYTVCMGLAASMGSILLSAGVKGHRSIFPSGEVMIHQPSIGGAQGTSADLEIIAHQIAKTKELGAPFQSMNVTIERAHLISGSLSLGRFNCLKVLTYTI